MEAALHVWMNIAAVLALVGAAVWATLLHYTTFFDD